MVSRYLLSVAIILSLNSLEYLYKQKHNKVMYLYKPNHKQCKFKYLDKQNHNKAQYLYKQDHIMDRKKAEYLYKQKNTQSEYLYEHILNKFYYRNKSEYLTKYLYEQKYTMFEHLYKHILNKFEYTLNQSEYVNTHGLTNFESDLGNSFIRFAFSCKGSQLELQRNILLAYLVRIMVLAFTVFFMRFVAISDH